MIRSIKAMCCIVLLLISMCSPVIAAPFDEILPLPEKPLEEIIIKAGNWHGEAWSSDEKTILVTDYIGSYEQSVSSHGGTSLMEWTLEEEMAITAIKAPFILQDSREITFTIVGSDGERFGPYPGVWREKEFPYGMYTFSSLKGVLLPAGTYQLEINHQDYQVLESVSDGNPSFLVKGYHGKYYRDYDLELRNVGIIDDQFNTDINDGDPHENDEELVTYEPIAFILDDIYIFEEVKINTWNNGEGAEPGIIILVDEDGDEIEGYYAEGEFFGGTDNGLWVARPNLILFPGEYYLYVTSPEVVVYDEEGIPEFSLSFIPIPEDRVDFTGVYKVDLYANRLSTMMGPDPNRTLTFSLENFEVTVLDKAGGLEIIGRYEGVPFSIFCPVVEEDENSIKASYEIDVDLSMLPASTKIQSTGFITISYQGEDAPKIEVVGQATYSRQASEEQGGDFNTYEISAKGELISYELPPFVISALGRVGTVGAFPGPASATQAAVGLLFPPLVGLMTTVLMDALKPKPKPLAPGERPDPEGVEKYTREWFKRKYPDMSDFMIAMQILAVSKPDPDSMFKRDDSEEDIEKEHKDHEEPIEEDSREREDPWDREEDIKEDQASDISDGSKKEDRFEDQQPDYMEDMEKTITINSGVRGQPQDYHWDSEAGGYINPQTGGMLNMTAYERYVKPNIESNKRFNDEQFRRVSEGDTAFDRELREGEAQRQADLRQQNQLIDLERRYGVQGAEAVRQQQRIEQARQMDIHDHQMWIGDIAQAGETASRVVGVVADTAIDGLASATGPAGRGIRAGYKVIKQSSSTMATDGMSVRNALSGAIEGAGDAATDFTSSGPLQRLTNTALKTATKTAADMVKDNPSSFMDSLRTNAIDGGVSYISGTVLDGATGMLGDAAADYYGTAADGFGLDIKTTQLAAGKTRIAIKQGKNYVKSVVDSDFANGFVEDKLKSELVQSSVKLVKGLTDEFVVKPHISGPTSNFIKG